MYGLRSRFIVATVFSASLVNSINIVRAQSSSNEGTKKVEKHAYISIIALGAVPLKRYKLSEKAGPSGDKLSIMLPPKKGEHPPARLYYKSGKKDGRQLYDSLRIGFNNPTGINKIRPRVVRSLFSRNEKSGMDYVKFMNLPALEANSQTLFLLTEKSKKTDRWLNEPSVTRIDLNSGKLKDAKLYMKNLSSETVYVWINKEEAVILKKGEGKIFEHDEKSGMIRLLAMKKENNVERKIKEKQKPKIGDKPEFIPLMRTGTRLSDSMITAFTFYNADPATNSGKTVGVCRIVTKRLKLVLPEEEKLGGD